MSIVFSRLYFTRTGIQEALSRVDRAVRDYETFTPNVSDSKAYTLRKEGSQVILDLSKGFDPEFDPYITAEGFRRVKPSE